MPSPASRSTGTLALVDSSPDVLERERQFYNESDGAYRRWRRLIWRAAGALNRNDELSELYGGVDGKRLLLYGCGRADRTWEYLDEGAVSVAGIDVSDGEIAAAKQTARERGYDSKVDFRVADAHDTGFPENSFDLVIGYGILHHLDVDRALNELRRILAPGGRVVLREPLAHNPVLRLGRRLTPAARTEDEHPLTVDDLRLCAEVFPRSHHQEVELTSIALMPLNLVIPRSWQEALAPRIAALDDRLMARYPRLRRHARMTHIVLE